MTTDILSAQIQAAQIESANQKKEAHEAQLIQLILYSSTTVNHLKMMEASPKAPAKTAAVGDSDPWSGFNWPVAPTGGGSNVDSNPNSSPVNPFSTGGSDDGYLQQLQQVLEELQSNPNDLNLLPTLIELLTNIGNNPAISNDPEFQQIMQNFPVGEDGQSALTGIAQVVVLMEFGSTGGDTTKTSAFISQLLGIVGSNNSTMSPFYQSLVDAQANLGTLSQDYMQDGQLGFYDSDSLFQGQKYFVPCSQAQFYTYIGGLLGNDVVSPSWGGDPNQSFSSTVQMLMNAQFKELLDKLKHTKDPGEALILLMMLVGANKDEMYQNQINGLSTTVNWLSDQVSQVENEIGDLNPNEFSGTDGTKNAQAFFGSLVQLYESAKANPNASGLVSQLNAALAPIFSLKDANGNTLFSDYSNPTPDNIAALTAALNKDCGNLASGDGLTLSSNLKQISQLFTNQSQAEGTKLQAISSEDSQVVNFMKGFLTDPTSGVTAAENAITSNFKTN